MVSVIALIGAAVLGVDKGVLQNMANPEYARGLITFLFAVVTIGTALVLVVSALIGNDTAEGQKQFQQGKEVFSLLLGVFGTVVGYYFGSTHSGTADTNLHVSGIEITPEISHFGDDVRLRALVAGGMHPYQYTVSIDDGTPTKGANVPDTGLILAHIAVPKRAVGNPLPIHLKVTDAAGREVESNSEIKLEPLH